MGRNAATDYQTPQERQFAQLTDEILGAIDTRFSALEKRVQDKFAGAAGDIARMKDDIADSNATRDRRFMALAGEHQRGGEYRGIFKDAVAAAGFGALCRCLAMPGAEKSEATLRELQRAGIGPGSGATGGFLLPEEILSPLLVSLESYGVLAADALVPPGIEGFNASAIRLTTGATTYYPDTGSQPTESDLRFSKTQVNLTRFSTLVSVDRWMFNAPSIMLGDFIGQEIVRSHSKAEDNMGFMGDGSQNYARRTGMFKRADTDQLTVTADSGDDTFAEVIAASTKYLGKVIGTLPQWADAFNPAWYMHRSIFFSYLGVRDSQLRPIADILNVGGKPGLFLFTYPVRITQVAPALSATAASTTMLIFGAMRRAALIVRNRAGMELRINDSLKMLEGQVLLLLDVPEAVEVLDNQAFVQLKTNAA